MTETLSVADTQALLGEYFAPWIQAMNIEVLETGPAGSTFRLPASDDLMRSGGGHKVLCGQALASAADTISALTLTAANGRFRNCTTVDMTVHFARPVLDSATILTTEIVSNGRRMATLRVAAAPEGAAKTAAVATLAFAYLED